MDRMDASLVLQAAAGLQTAAQSLRGDRHDPFLYKRVETLIGEVAEAIAASPVLSERGNKSQGTSSKTILWDRCAIEVFLGKGGTTNPLLKENLEAVIPDLDLIRDEVIRDYLLTEVAYEVTEILKG